MAELLKYPKDELPDDFYRKISHLWLMHEDGRIEAVEKVQYDEDGNYIESEENAERFNIHADYWGELAWETNDRGYYSEKYGLVTAHSGVGNNPILIYKLARKFRNAMYYKK